MASCEVAGETLVLLPERVAYWPSGSVLFVADFHLGRAASFRKAGIPLPSGTTTENVERLDRALRYALCGHIHPAVRLSAPGEEALRLPCFWFGRRYGVLPAFGAFTGAAEVLPRRGDQVFVIAEQDVLRVA